MSPFPTRLAILLLGSASLLHCFLSPHAITAQDQLPEPVIFTTKQDHQEMLTRLGISKLRPGKDGNENAPNAANYDEALANPFPLIPNLMSLPNGDAVNTAEQWWKQRRPELVELLEREVYGRVPNNVPVVRWQVKEIRDIEAGGRAAIQKHIVGVVDNSACPTISVNISMSLTLPKDATGPVPVLMSFGWTPFEPSPFAFGGRGGPSGPRPPSKEDKLIAAGWGSAILNPSTVQDDAGGFQRNPFARNVDPDAPPTGAGLTRGIIGLTNLGQPRKVDDWGALRAWGWGASRGLDYLETEPAVDSKKVGIAGVSRYGKAALVTLAFDDRFAMGLIASSGAGGTRLFRRNFGESLENLASSGEYHWMAGNYLKYASEESDFGKRTANDLPVDSHMTIALCAPRLTFISHGIPEKGDANWLDHRGSFMAAIASQPAFRLLGAKDLGRSDDYQSEQMPAVSVDLLDGQLAWRQHDGGHTDEPNVEHFIRWANKNFSAVEKEKPITTSGQPAPQHLAVQRTDANSLAAHEQLLAKTRLGKIDTYFIGDSITRRWGATDYPKFLAHWRKEFTGWNAANFGWGGDTTNNILWRLQNGELDGISPKVVVLQAGTNNLPWKGPADKNTVTNIVDGMKAILAVIQEKCPTTITIVTGVFPRSQNQELKESIEQINKHLAELADGNKIRFLNINHLLSDKEGNFVDGMSLDGLHLELQGYQVWAEALTPLLTDILGQKRDNDLAPPPTGDPSANVSANDDTIVRTTTPDGVEIPAVVRIKRPTALEIAMAQRALEDFVQSTSPQTKAILDEYPSLIEVRVPEPNSAVVPNLAPFFRQKHEANLAVAKQGQAELLFIGDSITDFWRNSEGPFAGKRVLDQYFGHWKIANFGIAGDTTQGLLYRLSHGEEQGFSPKAIMLMIGTNNIGRNTAEEIAEGIGGIVLQLQRSFPDSKILLLGVFPRGDANAPVRKTVLQINSLISKLQDDNSVHYLDIGAKFLDDSGNIPQEVMSDGLHPTAKGYEIWAEAVKESLNALMAP